jgi:hypothetical protein
VTVQIKLNTIMKAPIKTLSLIISMAVLLTTSGCQKEENNSPELPPLNSMVMDFNMGTTQKSAILQDEQIVSYYAIAALNVGFWSTVAALHTAIPAAAFEKAFESKPSWDEALQAWVWSYNAPVANDTYEARLTGKIESDSLKWEMYLSKVGDANLQDLLWFEGKSHPGRTGGWWVLNYPKIDSGVQMQAAIRINWSYTNEKVFSLRYTYVADMVYDTVNQYYVTNNAKDNYIEYGRVDDPKFDAYYILFVREKNEKYNIYWNTSTRAGRIEKEGTTEEGCWNSNLVNTLCD